MFSAFKKKEKSKLYLGAIAVVPQNEFIKSEGWAFFSGEDLEDSIKRRLEELFSLPNIPIDQQVNDQDLAIDILVSKLRGGEFGSFQTTPIDFPIFWRPKVQLKARLFYINNNETKSTFEVSKKMPWGQYWGRVVSLRGMFSFSPLFDSVDLEPILYSACNDLLDKLIRST